MSPHNPDKQPAASGGQYRALRLECGLTQEALAKRIGMNPMTISKRETGQHAVDAEAWLALKYIELERKYEMVFED